MSSATSPNQAGVEGTESEEVWILTDTLARLSISASFVRNHFVLPHYGGTCCCLFATNYNLVAQFVGLGTASNRVSFSNSTSQPSFALAKVTGLTTTLLSGRHTQPAQDWLPTSIPHTY